MAISLELTYRAEALRGMGVDAVRVVQAEPSPLLRSVQEDTDGEEIVTILNLDDNTEPLVVLPLCEYELLRVSMVIDEALSVLRW